VNEQRCYWFDRPKESGERRKLNSRLDTTQSHRNVVTEIKCLAIAITTYSAGSSVQQQPRAGKDGLFDAFAKIDNK